MHEHSHEHTHEHSHEHSHEHTHEHSHEHSHHGEAVSKEELLALLTYMSTHNKHHAEELHELAHSCSEEAAALLHEACHLYAEGTEKLDQALALLQEA